MGQVFTSISSISDMEGFLNSFPEAAEALKSTSLPDGIISEFQASELQTCLNNTSQIEYVKKKEDPSDFLNPDRVHKAVKQIGEAISLMEVKKKAFFTKVEYMFTVAESYTNEKDFNGVINTLIKRRCTEKRASEIIQRLENLNHLRNEAQALEKEVSTPDQFRVLQQSELLSVATELAEFDFIEIFIWMKRLSEIETEAESAGEPLKGLTSAVTHANHQMTKRSTSALDLMDYATNLRLTDQDKDMIKLQFKELKKRYMKANPLAASKDHVNEFVKKAKLFFNQKWG